jgi:hypothetical protein
MLISVDAITRHKLQLTKQLFEHALILSSSTHSQVLRIMAVIGFDVANETALKCTVTALDTSKQPSEAFQGLVQQANGLLVKAELGLLPDQARVQHVHTIRNDAQHKARYPNETEVNDCRTYSRDFLQNLILQVWGLQFDRISLVDLIQNREAKEFLSKAESELQQGYFDQAVNNAATGLTWVIDRVERAVVGPTPNFVSAFVMSDSLGRNQKANSDTYNAFVKMQRLVLYLALGMDVPKYINYTDIAGNVMFFLDGHWERYGGKKPIEKNDAEFVLAYASSAIVQIEERVGDLDKPFGSEWFLA